MMPCLHNYVTVDPQAFLGEPKYCEVIFNMCKQVWHHCNIVLHQFIYIHVLSCVYGSLFPLNSENFGMRDKKLKRSPLFSKFIFSK